MVLNQSKVGTDILGDIKEVCNDIVTTSKNVALDPNSAYLFISWQNVNGNVNQPCMMLLLTCASTITQVTIYGTPLNIWKCFLPADLHKEFMQRMDTITILKLSNYNNSLSGTDSH